MEAVRKESYSIANWKVILTLFFIMLFFTFYLFPDQQNKINQLAGTDLILLDSRLKYSIDEVMILLNKLGFEGRDTYYFVSSTVDLIYPAIYGSFFVLLLSNLLKKITIKTSWWRWLLLLPIIAVMFDYFENITIQRLLKNYPNITESHVVLASLMTELKWMTVISILLLLIVLGFTLFINKINQRSQG